MTSEVMFDIRSQLGGLNAQCSTVNLASKWHHDPNETETNGPLTSVREA